MTKIKRQAVIVIHGMGEQRPTDTLRSFVDGVKWQMEQNDPSEVNVKVRSKPDSIGDIYETVRLSMESNYKAARPITDFYEFYWAHNMRGTTFGNMSAWLKQVVFVKVSRVPRHLQKIWWTIWGIFVLGIALSLLVAQSFDLSAIQKALIAFFGGSIVSFVIGFVTAFLKNSFLNSLGDVARYMTPEPNNIKDRSEIRQQGINFLKKLHAVNNRTRPERIIVVAHSLGSVVAYDLLRLLWTEYNTQYNTLPTNGQPMLDKVNNFSVNPNTIAGNFSTFTDAQHSYWKEARALENPWLITDFITLGAAVNSLDYFMVNKVPIKKLIEQREIPVCPPEIDTKDQKIYYLGDMELNGKQTNKCIEVPHHGALFAMVRWTNIYYTSDFVGGPAQRVFGTGIADIKIDRKSLWCYPGGHTDYWTPGKDKQALIKIVSAMSL
ncbi:hypothetical protein [Pedobacter sp. MR2016-24]|uniref:hypothetical protein n=1 Tax=Pedobacter sp. MR2016-24 TaxID=2994466 RepID=UPI002246649D|nr:hypothetical protein [Pedobacter sp. MR2016-24]MCX2484627.1 hypothetical protein [Pedobacter sp. MR2016-24]